MPNYSRHVHVTTLAQAGWINHDYRNGETLTASVIRRCDLPRTATDIRFLDDIFEAACRIEYWTPD